MFQIFATVVAVTIFLICCQHIS